MELVPALRMRRHQGDDDQREEPHDVRIQPVVERDLKSAQDGGAQRGDLRQPPAGGEQRDPQRQGDDRALQQVLNRRQAAP